MMTRFLAQDYHQISPPVNYSFIPSWVIFLGVFLALLLIGLCLLWYTRWRARRPAKILTVRDQALQWLERARREIELESPYQFSIRVSDILRRYVTEQFQLPLTRQTSVEFLNAISQRREFSGEEKSLLTDFLNRCDLIKFARYDATTEDSRQLLEEAFRFVQGGQFALA